MAPASARRAAEDRGARAVVPPGGPRDGGTIQWKRWVLREVLIHKNRMGFAVSGFSDNYFGFYKGYLPFSTRYSCFGKGLLLTEASHACGCGCSSGKQGVGTCV